MAAPVLVIDFGSQVTQLIARRVREGGVYCEIVPFNKAEAALAASPPSAIILSGGPASVTDERHPARAAERVRAGRAGARHLLWRDDDGAAARRRASKAGIAANSAAPTSVIERESPLFEGLGAVGDREPVWMSHGDKIIAIPPGF